VSLGLGLGVHSGQVSGAGIEAAWAGGPDGRLVTDRLLALLPTILTRSSVPDAAPHHPGGCAYLLLLEENGPAAIAAHLACMRLHGKVIRSVRAQNELLHVMKVTWALG
jgi:release factor glutamine methyltransferase